MRSRVRLRVLLPVAVVLTLLSPAFRQMAGGGAWPDLWLLLLLAAVPVPAPDSWRRPTLLVLLFGLLRASVSAVSPFNAWAGLGAALFVREALSRRLNEYRLLLRFLIGFSCAIPLTVLDRLAAARFGNPIPLADAWWRCFWVGLALALFARPQLSRLRFGGRNA